MSVRVVTLPSGEDPDTFVRAQGKAGLESQLSASLDVFDRKIQILDRAGWFGELQKKRRALDRLLPTIRATSDEIMRDLYIGRASEVTGVNKEILLRELGARTPGPAIAPEAMGPPRPQRPAIRGRTTDRRTQRRSAAASAERELVRAMLHQRSQVESIAERIGPDSFHHPVYREIFAALLNHGEEATMDELASDLEPDALEEAQEMLGEVNRFVDMQRTIDDSITQLHVLEMERRLTEIDGLLPLASEKEAEGLQREKQQLVMQMRASGKMRYKAFRR